MIARGSLDDKLRWTFHLYDMDSDGVISKSEMTAVVASVYGLMGRYTSPAISSSTIRQHVDHIFEARQLASSFSYKSLSYYMALNLFDGFPAVTQSQFFDEPYKGEHLEFR